MTYSDIKILIPCLKTIDFVYLGEIIRCEGLQNYTKIFLLNGTSIVSSSSIGLFKKALASHEFFSTHKSHLINMRHVLRYHKEGMVEMIDESFVPVARRKKDDFYKTMMHNEDVVAIQMSGIAS